MILDRFKILFIISFCLFFISSVPYSFAQIDEKDGREYVEEVGDGVFAMCFDFKEYNTQLFLSNSSGTKLFIKEKGGKITPFDDPNDLTTQIDFFSLRTFGGGKAHRSIPTGNLLVLEGKNDILLQIDIEKKTISLLQDFKEYLSSDLLEGFSGLNIKNLTSIINGKVYCNVSVSSNTSSLNPLTHILQVDVVSGDWVNLTPDYLTDPEFDPSVRNNFNYINNFVQFEEDIYFLKTEDRPLNPTTYFDPFQVYLYKLSDGTLSVQHEFEINEPVKEFVTYVSNGELNIFMTLEYGSDIKAYLYNENNGMEIYSSGELIELYNFMFGSNQLTEARIYNNYSYFIQDGDLVKIESGGLLNRNSPPVNASGEEVGLEFIHGFDFNDDGMYFLGDAVYESEISETVGKLWKYSEAGWTEYDVETTDKGLASEEDKIYVSGFKPKDPSDPESINVVGIYDLKEDGSTELHWFLRTFTIELNSFDKTFFFRDYTLGSFAQQPLKTIPHFGEINLVNFEVAENEIFTGSSVQFSDLTEGDILSREWKFENGSPATSNEKAPLVTYESAGKHAVELAVTYSNSSVKVIRFADYITVNESVSSDCPAPPPVSMGLVYGGSQHIDKGTNLGVTFKGAIKDHARLVHYLEETMAVKPNEFYDSYEIHYRPNYELGADWRIIKDLGITEPMGLGQTILPDLKPSTVYEIKIRTKCGEGKFSAFSNKELLKTDAPIPLHKDFPTVNEQGEVEVYYLDHNGFDSYTDIEVFVKHHDEEDYASYIFEKGEPLKFNVEKSGFHTYKLRYHYNGADRSDQTSFKHFWASLSEELDPAANEPRVKFDMEFTSEPYGSLVSFTDQSNIEAVKWSWIFEGGYPEESEEQNPQVFYDENGLYGVSLTIEDETGATYTFSYDSIVAATVPVEIEVYAYYFTTEEEFYYDDNQSEGMERTWYFEGGEPFISHEENPYVKYPIAGTYDVSLEVNTPNGPEVYTFEDFVTVEGTSDLKADFSLSDETPSAGESLNLIDNSSGKIIWRSWKVEGNSAEDTADPQQEVVWEEEGEYEVVLLVMDSLQQISRMTKVISVSGAKALGVKDEFSGSGIEVYPVPAKRFLLVKSGGTEPESYSIINLLGQEIQSGKLGITEENRISLENIPSGGYVVRIKFASGTEIKRVVVKK